MNNFIKKLALVLVASTLTLIVAIFSSEKHFNQNIPLLDPSVANADYIDPGGGGGTPGDGAGGGSGDGGSGDGGSGGAGGCGGGE